MDTTYPTKKPNPFPKTPHCPPIITFNDIHGRKQTIDLTCKKFNLAFNVDCMEFLRACPDKSFSWIVADPPYGDGSSQTVHVEREREREARKNNGTDSANDSTDTNTRRTMW